MKKSRSLGVMSEQGDHLALTGLLLVFKRPLGAYSIGRKGQQKGKGISEIKYGVPVPGIGNWPNKKRSIYRVIL